MAKDISKTLVVGIGGTGQTVIRDIKKRLLRTYGEIPDLVMFMEFDTDAKKQEEDTAFEYYYNGKTYKNFKYQITNNEYLPIPFLGTKIAEDDPICNTKIDIDELKKVSARLNNKGAGGYRICGRTIFLQNSANIINALRNKITNLRSLSLSNQQQGTQGYNLVNNNINVFVIASLAGGTGSSAFMDMSRMLQIAGINVRYNVTAGTDQIFGMFFLPKFFEGKANTQNIRINTYTALSELDYVLDLNDAQRYPSGCRELADDNQDYKGQGGMNNGARVIFTSAYLIDSLTSRSQTNTFEEASSYVASFISASIAADANTIFSSFANSNHKLNTVKGKYQNYSGLGYCELRFNRHELVRFMLNRKLIKTLEEYKNGAIRLMSQIADDFIMSNNLNEGVKKDANNNDTRKQLNQLTDAIIDMTAQRFTDITMAAVDTGIDADEKIENSKTAYLNAIATAAKQSVDSFSSKKDELFANLHALLKNQQSGKGFGVFADLACQLKAIFNDMKDGLNDELTIHKQEFEAIEKELLIIKESIKENETRGWGWRSRLEEQENWLQAYSSKVRFDMGNDKAPTLARLKVEDARKKEAVAIYEEFIKIIDSYYKKERIETINGSEEKITGISLNVNNLYSSLISMLIRENSSYQPSTAAMKETLYADAYFKEYFGQHEVETMALTKQNANILDEYLNNIFTELPVCDAAKLAEMREKLLNLLPADGLLRQIQEERMSIDQLFIHCFGTYDEIENPNDLEANPQLKLLGQLQNLFDPLWQYVPFADGLAPDKNMVIGVYNPDFHIFDHVNGYSARINGWDSQRQYVSLGDPDRIVFMLMETAIPAHALMNADDWATEYNQKKATIYTFTDKRLEYIEMIKPGALESAEIAWAYGWLFGLIANPSNKRGLRLKPSHNYVRKTGVVLDAGEGGWYNFFATVKHSTDIFDCHQKFVNDQELSNDILNQAMALLDGNPIGNIKMIKEWVNNRKMWSSEIRGKEETSMTDRERKVIQDEVDNLAKCFSRLGYGVTLDNGRVTHPYSDLLE